MGGVYNVVLCDMEKMFFMRMDIGCYNVFDKLYGCCLKNGMFVCDKLIVFSGWIFLEVLLKVVKIGVLIVILKLVLMEFVL